eukprot:1479257-Pleurochrysis_carterae.AAC.1
MSLTEVEGLGDLINSDTEEQRKQAIGSMKLPIVVNLFCAVSGWGCVHVIPPSLNAVIEIRSSGLSACRQPGQAESIRASSYCFFTCDLHIPFKTLPTSNVLHLSLNLCSIASHSLDAHLTHSFRYSRLLMACFSSANTSRLQRAMEARKPRSLFLSGASSNGGRAAARLRGVEGDAAR